MLITTDIITMRSKPSAVALGFFDGVHLGHQAVIAEAVAAAEELDLVPMVFTFSANGEIPASKRSLTLLQSERHKDAILEEMGILEVVAPPFEAFMGLSPKEYVDSLLCNALSAKVLICGENYRFGKYAAAGVDELRVLAEERGIKLITVAPVMLDGEMVSSTRIRQAVRDGDMAMAQRLLGAPFAIEGEVVHGKSLGTTLGSPTINLDIPADFTVPSYGVYLSRTNTPLGDYCGVTNVGLRPTVHGEAPNCETFLLDFDGDLYGKQVTVSFLQKLRNEKKFGTLEELSSQIQLDAEEARKISNRILNLL